eukprot:TRINITY_DN5329_c0_g1_i1.p1 TRINITY_DN5329_c0_g1~~TRINITY_DN5329_c0_g1_i1.p1  ORF type:complete len:124 (-),score=16.57 TRINITY_DN5329_c0_g1_i1:191-562(-)
MIANNPQSESEQELMIDLAADIPQSYIVENEQWGDKEKAYLLYTKYIQIGAEFQINISAEQRIKYDVLLGDYQEFMQDISVSTQDLIDLFVPCCTQMMYLLLDSTKRFEETAVFYKLQQEFKK